MMFIPFSRAWTKFRRYLYTAACARALNVDRHGLDVSGPCVIHGHGKFVVGRPVSLRATPRLPIELYCAKDGVLTLGDGCFLNQGVHIACLTQVTIGRGCLLADQVLVMDGDFHGVGHQPARTAPIVIETGAWIGARAILLKGVTIGEGAIVGAGAVVTRSVPPRTVVAGNPAVVIRSI